MSESPNCAWLRLFYGLGIPLPILCRVSDIAAAGTTFNVFRSDAVWAEHKVQGFPRPKIRYKVYHDRASNLKHSHAERMRYGLCNERGLINI